MTEEDEPGLNPDRRPTYCDDKVHVMRELCATCIFHPGNRMNLAPGRLKDLTTSNRELGSAVTCHKTIYEEGYTQQAVCRGYFNAYKNEMPLVLAVALDVIQETNGKE